MVLVDNTLINQNLYTMKKLLLLFSAALTMLFVGCSQFDDSRIWDAIDELEDLYDELDGRLEDLEEACEKMNTNIEALQTLVTALQNHDTITSIAPIKQGDKIIGYTISFSKSEPITIYHGTDGKDGADGEDGKDGADGKDGYAPTIGVAQDEDGAYYWTLDGEWLLDENGNKIKAVGTDGKDGEDGEDGANGNDGSNGENGADGKDGITPQLEIRDGYWYISYDNGATWKELGKATGEDGKDGADGEDGKDGEDGTNGTDGQDGKDGDSLFQSVTWDEEYAYFTLADGTVIKIPLSKGAVSEVLDVNINHFYAGFREGTDDVHTYFVMLSDSYDFITEEWDNEESGFSYNLCFYSNVNANVVPNGTYKLSDTYEANTMSSMEGYPCAIVNNGEWFYHGATEGVVTISNNKLEATFTLDNGEVHHVVYEGSLKLYEEGDEEDTPTPPANEIWYTSTDGAVVTPYEIYAFGVNIISNTYENGVGIITFDGDVTEIGIYAFNNCSSLASVTIPDSITSIGEGAFLNCYSLTSITIPDSVTSIGDYAFFECVSFESITIPGSVTSIGEDVFRGCSNLASVTIEEGVTSIGDCAFWDCSSLVSIIIPDSVTSIGDCAFWDCSSLVSIIIPDSVTSIGEHAFSGCTSLTSITIPDSVTSIGDYAFYYCPSLTSVYCKPTTPPSGGGSWMFAGNASGRKIYVPTESVEAYKTADGWSDYADYIEPYNFGGGEGNAGVKEVAAVSLFGMYAVGDNFYVIDGYVSSGEVAGYNPPMDSWNYEFYIISDTEPVNDEIPLGTYTYVDYEKLASGEEELKTGIFTALDMWCTYVDANGEMQEYKYTEGTMVVSEGKIELTVTLDNGEVHHVVYEGSLQTWGEGA